MADWSVRADEESWWCDTPGGGAARTPAAPPGPLAAVSIRTASGRPSTPEAPCGAGTSPGGRRGSASARRSSADSDPRARRRSGSAGPEAVAAFSSAAVALGEEGMRQLVTELRGDLSANAELNAEWTASLAQRTRDAEQRAAVAEAELAAAKRELAATEEWASEVEERLLHAVASSPTSGSPERQRAWLEAASQRRPSLSAQRPCSSGPAETEPAPPPRAPPQPQRARSPGDVAGWAAAADAAARRRGSGTRHSPPDPRLPLSERLGAKARRGSERAAAARAQAAGHAEAQRRPSLSTSSQILAAKRRASCGSGDLFDRLAVPKNRGEEPCEGAGQGAKLPLRQAHAKIDAWAQQRDERERELERRRQQQAEREAGRAECLFDPFRAAGRRAGDIGGAPPRQSGGSLSLRNERREQRRKQLEAEGEERRRRLAEEELSECTFAPRVRSAPSTASTAPPPQAPSRRAATSYAEYVQRMKRSQELRAQERAAAEREGDWAADGGWRRGTRLASASPNPRWEGWAGEWVGSWTGGPALLSRATARKVDMATASLLDCTQCAWAKGSAPGPHPSLAPASSSRSRTAASARTGTVPSYSGWVPVADPASGLTYYAHTRSHEVTWECPPELAELASIVSHADREQPSVCSASGGASILARPVMWWEPRESQIAPAAAQRYRHAAESGSTAAPDGIETPPSEASAAPLPPEPARASPPLRRSTAPRRGSIDGGPDLLRDW